MEALNRPPTSYSRVEIAVVNGWITICVSSLADTFSVQPSGDFVVAGGDDSTRFSIPGAAAASGSGAAAASTVGASVTGSTSGSPDAVGTARVHATAQVANSVRKRNSTGQAFLDA